MKKSIYTGIFCTILGLYTNTPANASIVTRGFLDQALTDYATNTALDLKANQSDLTDLSNKIGRLPSGDLTGNSPAMDELFKYTQNTDTPVYPGSLSDLINQLYGGTDGAPSAISALLHGFDLSAYEVPVGILPAMDLGLNATAAAKAASTTATEAKTAADANTAKIGTLPEGITVQGMYEGWTDSERNFYPGLNILSKNDRLLMNAYNNTGSAQLLIVGAESTTIDGVDYTGPVYPLWKLSEGIDRIGTLPRGLLPEGNTAMHDLFKTTQDTNTPVYPVSLSDLINQFYGNTEEPGAIAYLLKGFKHNEFKFSDEYDGNVGVLPAMELGLTAKTAAETAQATADRAKALAESNSTAIGTLPSGAMKVSRGLAYLVPSPEYTYPTTIGDSISQLYSGILGLSGLADAVYYGNEGMGQTDTALQVKGLRQITDEIGTLPEGITVQGMYEGWTDPKGIFYPGLHILSKDATHLTNAYNSDAPSSLLIVGAESTTIDGVDYTGPVYPLWKLSEGIDKIGTLPSGSLLRVWNGITDELYTNAQGIDTPVYPTSLAEFIQQIYGKPGHPYGVLPQLVHNIDGLKTRIGTLPGDYETVGDALSMMDAKLGTLPRGGLLEGNTAMYDLFKFTQGVDTPAYPASLSDLIYQLYGGNEANPEDPGAIAALLKGFEYSESSFSVEYDGYVGVLPAMELGLTAKTAAETAQATANRAKALAESNSTAIGALPDGYETVGEALNAIKGIAEEAKATALAAIPDPKTEGSNGKYVLTVDIIGDNATYRWEPIDRGNTTTTTTTTE